MKVVIKEKNTGKIVHEFKSIRKQKDAERMVNSINVNLNHEEFEVIIESEC